MRTRYSIILLALLFFSHSILGQGNIGINEDNSLPDESALLDLKSTDKGMLVPRMTATERDDISEPAIGLILFNTTHNRFNFFNGTHWEVIPAGSDDHWIASGDDLHNSNTGNVGIGTQTPGSRLTIAGQTTDITLDQESASPQALQALSFAVDGVKHSSIHHDKSSGDLVFEFDKADLGTGDILFKRYGDDRIAIRNNGDVLFKRYGDDRIAIRGDGDVVLNQSVGSTTDIQALNFAVDGMAQSGLHYDKATRDLVVEFDKADLGTGDILFKRHGDDMLALRNNGDIVFKRLGDDRLAIRNDGEILFKRYGDDRLAIKTDGRVGIGLNDPASKLQVAGAVQVGDDVSAPTGDNVGAIRYRADGNHSYCEMVMQTGPVTYEWVVIMQQNW